jgi:hypothetical protein
VIDISARIQIPALAETIEVSDVSGSVPVSHPKYGTVYYISATVNFSLPVEDVEVTYIQDVYFVGVSFNEERTRVSIGAYSKSPLKLYTFKLNVVYNSGILEIGKKNIISLQSSIFDRSDISKPSFGIFSNSGNLEFNDNYGRVISLSQEGLLLDPCKVEIFVENKIFGLSEKIGTYYTDDWSYDNDNGVVSVSFKDDLEEWQDIYVKGFIYDPRKPYSVLANGSMENLYRWLRERTPSKYNMVDFNELNESVRSILANTIIEYPSLKDGFLWSQWLKLCDVCGLYIYKNKEGKTTCSYTYGS